MLAASTSKLSPSVILTLQTGAHTVVILKRWCLTWCRLAAKGILGSTLIMCHFLSVCFLKCISIKNGCPVTSVTPKEMMCTVTCLGRTMPGRRGCRRALGVIRARGVAGGGGAVAGPSSLPAQRFGSAAPGSAAVQSAWANHTWHQSGLRTAGRAFWSPCACTGPGSQHAMAKDRQGLLNRQQSDHVCHGCDMLQSKKSQQQTAADSRPIACLSTTCKTFGVTSRSHKC